MINVAKRLRIAIEQRKPSALDLHHHAMAGPERVTHIRKGPLKLSDLSGFEWFWFVITFAELASERLTAD